MHKLIKLFSFFIALSISQCYATSNEFISASNSRAFSFFLPTGQAMAIQYLDGLKRYSASEIIDDFNNNELRAKKKYKYIFIINSTARAIKQDFDDGFFVLLRDDDGGFESFYAYYDKKSEGDLEFLNEGDNVEFICSNIENIIMPRAECFSIALNLESQNIQGNHIRFFDNAYKSQNTYKATKITFILYSLLKDKIEKDCEESIEACNLAARRFTDNGALLDSMLEPYADMLSKIGNN